MLYFAMNGDLLVAFAVLLLSWILRAFGAVQAERDPLDKPLIWNSSVVMLGLAVIWMALLVLGLLLCFSASGASAVIAGLGLYFLAFPVFGGRLVRKLANQKR